MRQDLENYFSQVMENSAAPGSAQAKILANHNKAILSKHGGAQIKVGGHQNRNAGEEII